MHPESTQAGPAGTRRVMRVDGGRVSLVMPGLQTWAVPLLAVMAIGFVLLGAGNLDLGPVDARQGLAASEPLGPLGQVCGSWAPDLWPGRVAASRMATLFEGGGRPTPGSVLWPAALAAVAIGWTLARRHDGGHGSTGRALGRALLVRLPGRDRSFRRNRARAAFRFGDRGRD